MSFFRTFQKNESLAQNNGLWEVFFWFYFQVQYIQKYRVAHAFFQYPRPTKKHTPANSRSFVWFLFVTFVVPSFVLMSSSDSVASSPVVDTTTKSPVEVLYDELDRSFASLVMLCMGMKDQDGEDILNLTTKP